ncbi:MAG: nucleotidyltransferase family protein [Proteobacteria bacterium]|nr:MAG: nucleotidyltransferase family protein [Pseudomonadota bacterium]
MKAFILAAGRGQRLQPLTNHTPKPLVEVHGKPLLLHHLLALKKAGFRDIVINVSWLGEQIIDFLKSQTPSGLHITISDERNQALETGGGMLKALKYLGESPFLSINADVFTDIDYSLLKKPSLNNDLLRLVLVPNPEHNRAGDFSIVQNRLCQATANQQTYTYSGIGIYSPVLYHSVQHRRNEPFSVVPLIHQAIKNKQAGGYIYTGHWTDVGTIERFAELNQR